MTASSISLFIVIPSVAFTLSGSSLFSCAYEYIVTNKKNVQNKIFFISRFNFSSCANKES